MEMDEIVELIKQNLFIRIDEQPYENKVIVKLCFGHEQISEDYFELKNAD